jgi:proton-dependent oligopeptide transporter, POT family
MLCVGVGSFIRGSPRYVKTKPKGSMFASKSPPSSDTINLMVVVRISILVIPFNIAYSQMATTFILQGTVMNKCLGYIDAASMNNADAIAVLAFGSLISSKVYPELANRGIKIPTTYKFAIGSALGAMAIAWALFVEYMIRSTYDATGGKISIMWQAMSYILIGIGEIFAVSAAYEAAFTASPPDKKIIASALNLFCIGGLPNIFCIILYNACQPWFKTSDGTSRISRIEDYTTTRIAYYFWVLFAISMIGVVVNLLPSIREFVESIEEKATDLLKSPKTPVRVPRKHARGEESPLIKTMRHQAYLKYGRGPALFKMGSMRAGASQSQRNLGVDKRLLKRSVIAKLYRSEPVFADVISEQGRPVTAGALLRQAHMLREERPILNRANSN